MIGMLHAGGWDEMLLIGVALVVGFGIVMLGGKKKPAVQDSPESPTPETVAPLASTPRDARAPRPVDDRTVAPHGPLSERDVADRSRGTPADGAGPARSREDARTPSDSRITPAP